jgi:hypothetical protein
MEEKGRMKFSRSVLPQIQKTSKIERCFLRSLRGRSGCGTTSKKGSSATQRLAKAAALRPRLTNGQPL